MAAPGEERQAQEDERIGTTVRIVTLNVDGLGDYRSSPACRMGEILDLLLENPPDVLLLQEVIMDQYLVLRERLADWHFHRMRESAAEYFLVTVVRAPALAADKCSSFVFAKSMSGRHLLIVRRGPWAFVNVHAESGGNERDEQCFERDERGRQLQHMSRSHERDPDHAYVLAGDFNVRQGEDDCLLSKGWVDAWRELGSRPAPDEWTWKSRGHDVGTTASTRRIPCGASHARGFPVCGTAI